MPEVIEHRKFVCTDALNNNNKFWEYFLRDDKTVVVKYGRVGKTCSEEDPKAMTRRQLDKKISEKKSGSGVKGTPGYKPPYREVKIISESTDDSKSKSPSKIVVREAAISQIARSNPELTALIERLVAANKHELFKATGGQMDIDLKTGIISTPIGVVTKDTIIKARPILSNLAKFVVKQDFNNKKFISNLNDYLMLIPQTVGHGRGWHTYFLPDEKALQNQSSLLDQLMTSTDIAAARMAAAVADHKDATIASMPSLFDAEMVLLTDQKEIDRITKLYMESINPRHETRNMRPVRFYEIKIPKAHEAYQTDGASLSNQWQLWHGTRMFNVLSILKNSLFCPPSGGSYQVTGRMFGDGIYGSDQSTKALNYAYGYWDGGVRDKSCFMFLVDFAMGKHYTPSGRATTIPKGYDSMFAKADVSGVHNNEMIVYRNSQVNPRFLIEFEDQKQKSKK